MRKPKKEKKGKIIDILNKQKQTKPECKHHGHVNCH